MKRRNESAEAFLDQAAATGPDLLLVPETDAWWGERLSALRDEFRHQVQSIPDDHAFYGMHLFSKLKLISPEFRFFFSADTPTAVPGSTTGRRNDRLHRPPSAAAPRMVSAHDDAGRPHAPCGDDGAESNAPTIVAGIFYAVPWEYVTRRAIRIGRRLDPRVGRGLLPTYDTESDLISWPLDQILFQPQFTVRAYETLPDFGSDHRAVVATLCHEPGAAQDAPELLAMVVPRQRRPSTPPDAPKKWRRIRPPLRVFATSLQIALRRSAVAWRSATVILPAERSPLSQLEAVP